MSPVVATCPVRIDFAGGTTDIWPLPLVLHQDGGPCTVNVALDLPAKAQVAHAADAAPSVRLQSHDQHREVTYATRAELNAALANDTCPLPLLGLAAAHTGPLRGSLVVETWAGSPEGAGLGGSSALLVALVGALDALTGAMRDTAAHQQVAQGLETMLVKTPTGFQDYFPPLLGGCLSLRGTLTGIEVTPIAVDLDALSRRLRIVYTGVPHHSGLTNWGVMREVFDGTARTIHAMTEIGRNANEVSRRLYQGDVEGALRCVLTDGTLREQLAAGVVTEEIRALDAAVRKAGALGTKVLGAGGGGCVLVVLAPDDDGAQVDAAIAAGPGTPIPVRLTAQGLEVTLSPCPPTGSP